MHRANTRRSLLSLALALASFCILPHAQAEFVTLDAVYSVDDLKVLGPFPNNGYYTSATGTNMEAASGLTGVRVYHEGRSIRGYIDQCAASGEFTLFGPNGDELTGSFLPLGSIYEASGDWFVRNGKNRFEGAQGGGSISIGGNPSQVRITGSVTTTPIPEPGTLVLLGLGAGVLGSRHRARRQRALDAG